MAPWSIESVAESVSEPSGSYITIAYISIFGTMLVMSFMILCVKLASLGQKTRSPQQRRMYVGSRARPSLPQVEPTIYVSPANLPPPPKYEALAPPSYEEVVGIHYPNYQTTHIQPITQPITSAMAHSSSYNPTENNVTSNVMRNNEVSPPAVITITTEERRTTPTETTS